MVVVGGDEDGGSFCADIEKQFNECRQVDQAGIFGWKYLIRW